MRSKEVITGNNPITSPADCQENYSYNQINQLTSATGPSRTFVYDADGNMTQGYTADGYVFSAAYDAENRLYSLKYTGSGGTAYKVRYYYSGDGFVAQTKVYQNGGLTDDTRYIRAGYLPLQERNGSNNITREYAWGLNMGGGIGGLLNLSQDGYYSYLYDGKGNVTGLLNSSQSLAETYTYDPFGKLLAKTGSLNQPFQFSTKPYDEKTGMSYYGYRFYSPAIGRWVNRDPLQEAGDINLYGFVGNNPINWVDPLGLRKCRGRGRVLAGGGTYIGKNGGWSTPNKPLKVAADSAAIISRQWGGKDKIRPFIGEISGTCNGEKGSASFSGVTEVIGAEEKYYKPYANYRDKLEADFPGWFIIELPSLKQEISAAIDIPVSIELDIPDQVPCPFGTYPSSLDDDWKTEK